MEYTDKLAEALEASGLTEYELLRILKTCKFVKNGTITIELIKGRVSFVNKNEKFLIQHPKEILEKAAKEMLNDGATTFGNDSATIS